MVSKYNRALDVNIYSLVHYPKSYGIWVGYSIIILIGISWFVFAHWLNKMMSEKNSRSIEKLVQEIINVEKQPNHRINIQTEDDFEIVGNRINEMLNNIAMLNNQNTELIQLKAEIEKKQLAAQLNPHFLYNTLETIRTLVMIDAEKSEEMILSLTEILRYSVDNTKQDILLKDDLKYIQKYIDIQKLRFGDRLLINCKIAPECLDFVVPKLLLQPLIENSIKYGFKNNMELKIEITGSVDNGVLQLLVADDGGGMAYHDGEQLSQQINNTQEELTSAIGLRNISRRLELVYGSKSGLMIKNIPGQGFEVHVNITGRG